jgi:enterochelin esterase-like enzyme
MLALFLGNACLPQDSGGTSGGAGSGGRGGTAAGVGGSAGSGGSGTSRGGSAGTEAAGTSGGSGFSGSGGSSGTAGTGTGLAGTGGTGGTGGAAGTGGVGGTGTGGRANGGRGGATAGTGQAGGGIGGTAGSGGTGGGAIAGNTGSGGQPSTGLPDPGSDGDGDSTVGPSYTTQSDLTSKNNPRGKSFSFPVTSTIFNGKDPTLTQTPVNVTRTIQVYVPAMYKDGTPAPVLIIQDGPGELMQVSYALDNLTLSTDPKRKLPPFLVIAVPAGGADSFGSERGLEYDTLSDRYARYITQEVMPAVQTNLKSAYPNLKFDPNASGRATLGCSSGGAAAFTMAWFRPDLFSRVIAYSATLVAQQDPKAPESVMYPHGAWDYHSDLELIKNDTMGRDKLLRIFHNANEMDNGATAAASGRHNWLMAGTRTAAALKAKGFHYKFVEGLGVGHCAGEVQSSTLADALVWVWRGYQPASM